MVKQITQLRLHHSLHLLISLHLLLLLLFISHLLQLLASLGPLLCSLAPAPCQSDGEGLSAQTPSSISSSQRKKSLGKRAEPEGPGCSSGLNKKGAVSMMENGLFFLWTCQSECRQSPAPALTSVKGSRWESTLWWCIVLVGCGVSQPSSSFTAPTHIWWWLHVSVSL